MTRNFLAIILVVGSAITFVAQDKSSHRQDQSVEVTQRQRKERLLEYLRDAAWSSKKAMRVYYEAECRRAFPVDYSMPFPLIEVQPPSRGKIGLAAIRDIFKNANNVRIVEEPAGVIRIWIGTVQTDVLRRKIRSVTLHKEERYDPDLAIGAIVNTEEIDHAMKSLGFTFCPDSGGLVGPAEDGLSSLPSSLRNLTLDEALDMVAKKWGGPLVYGVCSTSTGEKGTKLLSLSYSGYVLGTPF